jgi:hypothetical protein
MRTHHFIDDVVGCALAGGGVAGLFANHQGEFGALAARHAMPATSYSREFIAAGALGSYAGTGKGASAWSASTSAAFSTVEALNRPDGNLTGVSQFAELVEAKRLQLLCELVPTASVIGFLVNASNPTTESRISDMRTAARSLGRELLVLQAADENDLMAQLAIAARDNVGAVFVQADPFLAGRPSRSSRSRPVTPSRRATICGRA